MMGERGVAVDHSILNRWVLKYASEFEKLKLGGCASRTAERRTDKT